MASRRLKGFFLYQELMTHVESFQCEAQKVIQSSTTDVTRLQQLLDNGHTLDVDLPEIPKLKQVCMVHLCTCKYVRIGGRGGGVFC